MSRHHGTDGKVATLRASLKGVVWLAVVATCGVVLGGANTGAARWQAPVPSDAAQAQALPAALSSFARDVAESDFQPVTGYLQALLRALDIPVESQVLVFSATSLQRDRIAPRVPRAIYFNDHAYVGYVANSPLLEVALQDRSAGVAFYTIEQTAGRPNPQTDYVCVLCHDLQRSGVPRLIMRSHFTDSQGNALQQRGQMSALQFETTDDTPFEKRWGGWWVTGTHGAMRHMGNLMAPLHTTRIANPAEYVKTLSVDPGANITSLAERIDVPSYLTPHSDIVSLMVLGHQHTVENAIGNVRRELRALGIAPDQVIDAEPLARLTEPLVKALLFVGAVPLVSPVAGTTDVRRAFEARAQRDAAGRSLRELDLQTRLFTYPVSYMIYTDGFDALPVAVKQQVYRRIGAALGGDGTLATVDAPTREAAREILRATRPEAAPFLGLP